MAFTMKFKRLTIASALLGLALASPAFAQKINWRLTTYVPEGNQDYREYIELYVKNVELLTGGEIKIQPFGAGVLAPPFEAPQAVQKGIADMAYFFPAFMVNQDPANAFLAGIARRHVGGSDHGVAIQRRRREALGRFPPRER